MECFELKEFPHRKKIINSGMVSRPTHKGLFNQPWCWHNCPLSLARLIQREIGKRVEAPGNLIVPRETIREEVLVVEEARKRLNSTSEGNQAEVKVAEQRASLPGMGSQSRDYQQLRRAQREGSKSQPSRSFISRISLWQVSRSC